MSDLVERLREQARDSGWPRNEEYNEAADRIEALEADVAAQLAKIRDLDDALELRTSAMFRLEADNAALKARVDALMLEFCPDEMTQEQMNEWVKHQAAEDGERLRAERVEAERQYTCEAHKDEVKKGGACVWCEVAALFNERERAINAADHLRADIAALKAENAELKEIIGSRQLATQLLRTEAERDALLARLWANPKNFEEGPCFECGYRGHSYYQPNVHKCAAKYHAAIDAARKGKP